jgi:hypothetical protein
MRRRGANYLDICFIVGNAERSPGYIRCRIKILKLNKFRCIYVDSWKYLLAEKALGNLIVNVQSSSEIPSAYEMIPAEKIMTWKLKA